ncbi:flagellar motor protein MotB [Bacillus tianshenii]|nr:flagellar motor protein MotB [Bacillus tianshenii]
MEVAKKKKKDEGHVDESWLIPYADMLTLLLALFIVLFAASNVDAKKYEQISEALNAAFTGGTGVMEHPMPVQPQNADPAATEEKQSSPSEGEGNKTGGSDSEAEEELESLQQKIQSYIEKNELNEDLSTKLTDEGLLVTILNDAFFASGSADLTEETERIAREISVTLATKEPHQVIISGHTDDRPIRNAQFEDNWHLSVIRAVNFMKILLENDKLNPEHFSAKGFGEFKPVAPNDTAENRQKNRRVEVLILPTNVTTEAQVHGQN